MKSTKFRGYNIPKNVTIVPFLGGVLRDPNIFPEPKTFKPKRFLKDGKIDTSLPFIPFGLGKWNASLFNNTALVIIQFAIVQSKKSYYI